ncbi:MAG: transcriptional repressor [Deferribacterales bacterium]
MLKENEIMELLQKNNIRINKNRIDILSIISSVSHTISALEIIEYLKKEHKIDKVTIYRTLDLFESKGIVIKEIDHKGISRYCIAISHKPHLHFFCEKCKTVNCKEIDNLPIFGLDDGEIKNIEIKITGLCKKCKK